MGDIVDKLEYLNDTKEQIADAIKRVGGTVSNSDTFRSYAAKITSLKERATVDLDNLSAAGLNVIRSNGGGSANVPIATPEQAGKVAPDGLTITIDDLGVISAKLPTRVSELVNDLNFQTEADLIASCFTKEEIDSKLSEVAHFRGRVSDEMNLPINAQAGDICYNLANYGYYIYNGVEWNNVSKTFDLSDIYTKEEADAKFVTIDSANQQGFIQRSELAEYVKFEDIEDFCSLKEVEGRLEEAREEINATLESYAILDDVNDMLSTKANIVDVYTKEEVDGLIGNAGTSSEFITESDLEAKGYLTQDDILNKADVSDSLAGYGIQDAYTKAEVDELIPEVPTNISAFENDSNYITLQDVENKADKNDTYTKTEVDDLIVNAITEGRVDLTGYATTEEVNNQLLLKEDKGACYTKEEVDNIIDSIQVPEEYITEDELVGKGYLVLSDIENKANSADVYTKTEIDGKLAGAFHYKGSVANETALPEQAEQGDVYNALDTGANYAYTGSEWDKLSEVIDLSNVYTKDECDEKFTTLTEVNEQGFLVESDLSDYAKSSDIPTDFYTKEEVDNKIGNAIISGELDLSEYAKVQDVNNSLELKANVSDTYNKTEVDNLIGNIQLPEDVVTESTLESKGYLTQSDIQTELDNKQNKGDYALTSAIPTKVSQLTNDVGYITEQIDISGKADKSDTYTKQEVDNKFTEFNPDLSSCYTKEQTDSLLANKANTSDIPDTSSFATTSQLSDKQNKLTPGTGISIQNNVITCTVQQQDLSNYYTKSQVDAIIGDINSILDYILGA